MSAQPASFGGRIATVVALIAVTVLALGLAAFFRGEADQVSGSPAATNAALVDAEATDAVAEQVAAAVQRIYSYDFARLDENERAAGEVVHGSFAAEFQEQFGQVRDAAAEQEAVVTATVLGTAVKMLDGDRASVVVFVDQHDGRTQELLQARRLVVTAQQVDGSWKIVDLQTF